MKLLSISLLLLFSAPLYSVNEISVQNFHALVKKNDVSAVSDELLASSSLATAQNAQKDTALHVAARYSNDQMVALLAQGIDVNKEVINGMGDTPLIIASQYGNHNAVKALIAAGALVNGCGARGGTPLYFAAWSRQFDIAQTLLQAGADPEAKNSAGYSILYAANRGYANYMEDNQAMINLVKSYITGNDR